VSKALLGKDGYLFLVNDHNGVQAQTVGLHQLDNHAVDAIFAAHASARERAKKRGAEYVHIVAPNKETAYRDFLPIGYTYEGHGKTPLNQYNEQRPTAEQQTFFDSDLLRPSNELVSYERGESHWTPQGALHYVKEAFAQLGRHDDLTRLKQIALISNEFIRQGDLALHAGLPPEIVVHASPVDNPQVCHFEGDIVNEGYYRHYSCKSGAGRALILHDSFGQALFPFLSQIYQETLFFHCPNFAPDLESQFEPDVVIKIQAERFFPYIPETMLSTLNWLKEVERTKKTSGKTTVFFHEMLGLQ
jgi:hypothetical protein